jgi:hypothetical protein
MRKQSAKRAAVALKVFHCLSCNISD